MAGNNRATDIGGLIRYIRKRQNITQVALARQIGVRQSTISQIESGQIFPEDDLLVDISHTLNAPEILVKSCYHCERRSHVFRELFPELDENSTPPLPLMVELLREQLDKIQELTYLVGQLNVRSEMYRATYLELYQEEKRLQSMCEVLELVTTKIAGIDISEADI
jgi:transcriptional regulator with XRE-family HTH domain